MLPALLAQLLNCHYHQDLNEMLSFKLKCPLAASCSQSPSEHQAGLGQMGHL